MFDERRKAEGSQGDSSKLPPFVLYKRYYIEDKRRCRICQAFGTPWESANLASRVRFGRQAEAFKGRLGEPRRSWSNPGPSTKLHETRTIQPKTAGFRIDPSF